MLCFCAAAFINPPYTYVLVPFVVLAVYQLAYFLYEHHSSHPLWQQYGQQVHQWLVSKQQQALLFNAQSEIMCGFSLIFGLLFPTRRLVLMFAVWHILTMRYWSTDAAIHHRRVRRACVCKQECTPASSSRCETLPKSCCITVQ